MLSLSMSFLLWSWTRSRGSWAIHRRGRAEKPAKKHGFGFYASSCVGGAWERSKTGVDARAYMGRIDFRWAGARSCP